MSDLTASNCGCGCDNGCGGGLFQSGNCGNNSCSWIIILILLFSCCGNGNSFFNDGCGCGGNNCSWIIILILLFCCGGCGNCGSCGNNGCGC